MFSNINVSQIFVLDQDDLTFADDPDPVGHLLGLFDIVGGQDNRDTLLAQPADHLPHVAPQLDVDAGGRLVEEQDLRLVRERLGDHHPPLHPSGERHDLAVSLVPEGELAEHLLDVGRVLGLAEETPAEEPAADEAPAEEAAAEEAPAAEEATNEGESASAPAEGADDVAPPTEESPQPAEATGEGVSAEEPAEGAAEEETKG